MFVTKLAPSPIVYISNVVIYLFLKMEKSKGKSQYQYRRSGSLVSHMAEIERRGPPLTLECLAYRAAKWKYNMIIPNHLIEPSAYSADYVVKQVEKIYDDAKENGYNEPRYFVKHGLWCDLQKFLKQIKMGVLAPHERCFICYLREHRYPFIERDPPHDIKVYLLCRKKMRNPAYKHFIHHFYGYRDNIDYERFFKKEKFPSFIPFTQDDRNAFANRRVVFYIP